MIGFRVALAMVIGVAAMLAVAWSPFLIAYSQNRPVTPITGIEHQIELDAGLRGGRIIADWLGTYCYLADGNPFKGSTTPSDWRGAGAPRWAAIPIRGPERLLREHGHSSTATTAYGWPLRCMTAYAQGADWEGTWPMMDGWSTFRIKASQLTLPTRAHWPGMLLNSPVYIATAFVLLTLLARFAITLRARLRRRVGLCRGCGYDLTGLDPAAICPECGSAKRT